MLLGIYDRKTFTKVKQKAFSALDLKKEYSVIGACVDASNHFKDKKSLGKLEVLCNKALETPPSKKVQTYLHFYLSNIYFEQSKSNLSGRWNDGVLVKSIYHIQSAFNSPGFKSIKKIDKCAILTNLASRMWSAGRFIEALNYSQIALSIDPKFGMALFIQSLALEAYAEHHYLEYEWYHLLSQAEKELESAIDKKLSHSGERFRASMEDMLKRVSTRLNSVDFGKRESLDDGDKRNLGRSNREKEYRRWCLKQKLFLTSLNDISEHPLAADDIIAQPTVHSKLPKPPNILFHYTQLKQEYITARWMLFEGFHFTGFHYSDRRVELYDSLDDACYSYAIENLKIAFKTLYGILDKIAFLLNDYLAIGIELNNIYFRSIWYDKNKQVKQCFVDDKNYCFHGLFWLSMELFDKENRQTTSPESKYINDLRNRLEHRIIRIVHPSARQREGQEFYYNVFAKDSPDYDSVYLDDFEKVVLRLAKLVRSALIYLSLGIHAQEYSKGTENGGAYVVINGITYDNFKKKRVW